MRDQLISVLKRCKIVNNDECFLSILPIVPEIADLEGIQHPKKHHTLDVLGHTIATIRNLQSNDPDIMVASLLHDIGKVETTECDEHGCVAHKHWEKSAEKADEILSRLNYPIENKRRIVNLVKYHHVLHNAVNDNKIGDTAIKRIMRKHGENLKDIEIMTRADILSDHPHANIEIQKIDRFMERMRELD